MTNERKEEWNSKNSNNVKRRIGETEICSVGKPRVSEKNRVKIMLLEIFDNFFS